MSVQPGDLDRMRFAVYESCDISTKGVVRHAGIPWDRGLAALDELLERGKITNAVGHHHGDADLCFCERVGQPLTHWYTTKERA